MSWKRRALIALLVGAFAPASPDFAQAPRDDGARIAAEAQDAATRLQAYLDGVAKSGGRPDYSKPPASDLLGQMFNLRRLEVLPPPQGSDLPWLMDWFGAANGANKSIMFFGIAPPVTPQTDSVAMQRNVTRARATGGICGLVQPVGHLMTEELCLVARPVSCFAQVSQRRCPKADPFRRGRYP
jgi:hypothetical protein